MTAAATTLAVPAPESPLARSEDWAAMPVDQRRLRAAIAIRDHDLADLCSLVHAHLLLTSRRGLRVSPNSRAAYADGARDLIRWCRDNALRPHRLDPDAARRWLRALEARGLKPSSIKTRLAHARRLTNALLWAGVRCTTPWGDLRVVDPTPPAGKRRPYSPLELARLLEAASPRERLFVLLAAHAGLRASEVCALTWADIDADQGLLRIRSGKGGKAAAVALTDALIHALHQTPALQHQARLCPISRRRLGYIILRLCIRAHVTPRGYHALRHTCGTQLYETTRDIHMVARHLRHSQIATAAIYAELADGDYRAAIARMSRA